MFRRILRFSTLAMLALLVLLAAISQIWEFRYVTRQTIVYVRASGMGCLFEDLPLFRPGLDAKIENLKPMRETLFEKPRWGERSSPITTVFLLPWWLLMCVWGSVTGIAWIFTRTKRLERAFPVEEATAK
jgi:hypothetical protein